MDETFLSNVECGNFKSFDFITANYRTLERKLLYNSRTLEKKLEKDSKTTEDSSTNK